MSEPKVQVSCGFCSGAGKVQLHTDTRVCTSCRGKGTITVSAPATQCFKCGGTGKIGWRKCAECKATGWLNST